MLFFKYQYVLTKTILERKVEENHNYKYKTYTTKKMVNGLNN